MTVRKRQAVTQVTPEMIAAGVRAFDAFRDSQGELWVCELYPAVKACLVAALEQTGELRE